MAQLDAVKTSMVQAGASAASRVKRVRLTLWFAVAGAFSFWLPDVAVHFVAGSNFDSRHVRVITLLMPATFLLAYLVERKLALKRDFKWLGAAMLLGVWVSGGFFMALSAMLLGSGLGGATGAWTLLLVLLSVIPIVTFILASLDGSMFALLTVSLGALLVCGVRASRMLLISNAPPDTSPNSAQRSKAA
jgi:hypothetical protein